MRTACDVLANRLTLPPGTPRVQPACLAAAAAQPKHFQRAANPVSVERPDLIRSGLLEKLFDFFFLYGDMPQPGLYPLHEQSEEHDHERNRDCQPYSHPCDLPIPVESALIVLSSLTADIGALNRMPGVSRAHTGVTLLARRLSGWPPKLAATPERVTPSQV